MQREHTGGATQGYSSEKLHLVTGTSNGESFQALRWTSLTSYWRFLVSKWKTPMLRQGKWQTDLCHLWGKPPAHYQGTVCRGCKHAVKPKRHGHKNNSARSSCRTERLQCCCCYSWWHWCFGSLSDILCWNFQSSFQKCRTKNQVRGTSISPSYVRPWETSVCKALVRIHAYIGCDTVNAFTGCGKLGALKRTRSGQFQEAFEELGQSWDLHKELFKKLQGFTCKLLSASITTDNINTTRTKVLVVGARS